MTTLSRIVVMLAFVLPAVTLAKSQPEAPSAHGYWQGSIPEEKAEIPLQLDLRVDASGISGVITIQGREHHFQNGSVNGDQIEFTTPRIRESQRNVQFVWSGTVLSDRIKMSVVPEDNQGPVIEFVATRQGVQ